VPVRAIGIDFGEKRIGLALSDPTGTLARPWRTLARESDETAVEEIVAIVGALTAEAEGLRTIVVGLPLRLDGSPHALTLRVRAFAEALRSRVGQPLVFQDERLSSREAEARLALRERDWRRRKRLLDAAAAAVVLQDYLDSSSSEAAGVAPDEEP
jgi:putative Holliday junction resolvase